MSSIASRLQTGLHSITERLANLIRELPVERRNKDVMGVVVIAPDFYWGQVAAEQLNKQLTIKRSYEEWLEILRSAFRSATNNLDRRIRKADQGFRRWVELSSNWSISPDRKENEKKLWDAAKQFENLLEILASDSNGEIILIPDTNTIVSEPDPTKYKDISGGDNFVFLLLPTVLAELDDLKNFHRNPEFRDKVKKVITRIKGWRNQGPLRDGVTVSRTITVRATANEPDMQHTLTWLDRDNRDDRIIASVLEVQSAHPASRVVLITGDINLSNKADVAQVENAELGLE